MAIVTPYPVGTVTDPYADCDTGCPPDPTDPYAVEGSWTYNPPWVIASDTWNNAYEAVLHIISYSEELYFIRSPDLLYLLNTSTGAITLKASSIPKNIRKIKAFNSGTFTGIFMTADTSWADTRWFKWNEVDAWTGLSASVNNALFDFIQSDSYIYIGSSLGIERWDGISLDSIVVGGGSALGYPYFMYEINNVIYAIKTIATETVITSWDKTGTVSVPGVWVDETAAITEETQVAVLHNDIIYFTCGEYSLYSYIPGDNVVTNIIPKNGGVYDIRALISHSDGYIYAIDSDAGLYKWMLGDTTWTEVIASASVDKTGHRGFLEYNYDIYAGGQRPKTYLYYVMKMAIEGSGCIVSDPYDYESLCNDPAYTT